MRIPVSELIVRYLERLGIERVFGIPGAHILPVYDRLHGSSIQTVLTKHEQGAAFMAGGYARASGRIAACIATAGPGATNLVTGIANAFADHLPVLMITGETPTYIFGRGGLQESSGEGGAIDQEALFRGITRYAKRIERTDYLAQVLNQAASRLRSARPGPVLLSLPLNLQREEVEESLLDQIPAAPQRPASRPDQDQIAALAALLRAANHPVIIAGHGCIRAGAQSQLDRLSSGWGIPVASSLKAKGAIDEQSPLALGSLGVTSSGYAYQYISEQADLVLLLGASYNERTSYLWDDRLLVGKRVVQVDQDPSLLERLYAADLAIQGDLREVLAALLAELGAPPTDSAGRRATEQRIQGLKQQVNGGYSLFQAGFSLVERLFARLEHYSPRDLVLFDDNIIFAQNFFRVPAGCGYYPNSGISSLGHAIPAAIGASFFQRRPTFAILGDGGFQMCCMELMTAVNYQIPLNVVLFNNATMGLIRKNQQQQYGGRFIDCDFVNPDYALLARSFGIRHLRVERESDLDRLFAELDLRGGINLIEVMIDKNAFPNYSSKR